MKAIVRAMAMGAVLLAALSAAGCHAGPAAARGSTVQGCTAFGLYAIRHRIVVTTKPAVCEGLSRAQLNDAVGRAIYAAAGSGVRKVIWRRRAAAAGYYLAHLVSAPPAPRASPPLARPAAAAPQPAPGAAGAVSIAALIAWLIAAGSGLAILARWVFPGGLGRPAALRGSGGAPPSVIFAHLGLATAGLALWISFMATGWHALAWIATGLLVVIAGLGMATLILGGDSRPGTVRVAIGHGFFAMTTLLLGLLAALGAG